jgi:hypothetical protein
VEFLTDDSDIDIRTTGTDARLFFYSSGSMYMSGSTYFTARTAELPGSDIKLTSTLGHINIESISAGLQGVTLNVLASFGDLSVISSGDDGDIYFYADLLDIHADGDIVFSSSLNNQADPVGIQIDVSLTMTVISELLTYRAREIYIDGTVIAVTATGNSGGSINLFTNNNHVSQAATIQFSAFGEGGSIIFESELGDINFFSDNDNDNSLTTIITQNSIMKIPHNDAPGTADYAGLELTDDCVTGEMFFANNVNINEVNGKPNTSNSYVCMCYSQELYCVQFHEPPGNYYYNQPGDNNPAA